MSATPSFTLPFNPDLALGPPVWGAFLAAALGCKFCEEAVRYWCNSGRTDRPLFRICVALMSVITPLGLITCCIYVCEHMCNAGAWRLTQWQIKST
jgi:hypothetical protein